MRDYTLSKVYKIVGGEECYVGSTLEKYLSNRFACHKASYKRWKDGKGGMIQSYTLFDKYGVDNCKIELIELYPCESLQELRKREGEFIFGLECVNKRMAGVCSPQDKDYLHKKNKEWRDANKDVIKQKKKDYYQQNKNRLKQYSKKYYQEKIFLNK